MEYKELAKVFLSLFESKEELIQFLKRGHDALSIDDVKEICGLYDLEH